MNEKFKNLLVTLHTPHHTRCWNRHILLMIQEPGYGRERDKRMNLTISDVQECSWTYKLNPFSI